MSVKELIYTEESLQNLTKRQCDAYGDSHVFLEPNIVIKGYPSLHTRQIFAYSYLSRDATALNGVHTTTNGTVFRAEFIPIQQVVKGNGNPYQAYTVSERIYPGTRSLSGEQYGDAKDHLNKLLYARYKAANIHVIDYNLIQTEQFHLVVTDLAPSILGLMHEFSIF